MPVLGLELVELHQVVSLPGGELDAVRGRRTDETTAADTRHRGPARGARRRRPPAPRRRSPPRTGSRRASSSSSSRASARGRHAGAARRRRSAARPRPPCGDNPRVAYAEPDYVATASATEPSSSFVLPNDPGTLDGASEAAASAGDWAFKQWNFLPWEADSSGARLPTSPGGIDAIGAWRNLAERRPPRGRRRHRRRARHRHRLPRPRQQVRAQPRLRRRPVRQGLRLRRRRPPAARRKRPRHPRRRDDRREDQQRGRPHRPRLPGEADAGAGARQARPRPGQRHRQGDPLRRRPPRPGDQHELQLRLRQEGAGGRRSAARGLRARRRHGRLGRQPRLGDLRLGAGDRAAGDRRRRHHRGRLPRQLLAGRQGDRPGRAGRWHAGRRAAPRSRPGRSTR